MSSARWIPAHEFFFISDSYFGGYFFLTGTLNKAFAFSLPSLKYDHELLNVQLSLGDFSFTIKF